MVSIAVFIVAYSYGEAQDAFTALLGEKDEEEVDELFDDASSNLRRWRRSVEDLGE